MAEITLEIIHKLSSNQIFILIIFFGLGIGGIIVFAIMRKVTKILWLNIFDYEKSEDK